MPLADTIICSGSVLLFTAQQTNGGNAPVFDWRVDGQHTGANSNSFSTIAFGSGYDVRCIFTSSATCAVPKTITSGTVHITISTLPQPVASAIDSALNCTVAISYQWYLNGQPVAGATSQNYIAVADGVYQAETFNADGCSALSNAVTVTLAVTGVNAISASGFCLYPNPNHGQFVLSWNNLTQGEYLAEIFDATGRRVYKMMAYNSNKNENAVVRTGSLQQGIYLLKLTQGSKTVTGKLVIE